MEYPKSLQPIPKDAKKVFEGIIFSVWQWPQKMFDGSIKTFEKVSRNASVGILPVTKDNKIIITIQEQPGMKQFISLLGGVVDERETVVKAAHRELKEEAGLVSNDLELWYSEQPVTKVEWPIYLFIARNCKKVSSQKLDSGEKIKTKTVSFEEFLNIIYLDEFRDKDVALQVFKLQKNPEKFAEFKNFLFRDN